MESEWVRVAAWERKSWGGNFLPLPSIILLTLRLGREWRLCQPKNRKDGAGAQHARGVDGQQVAVVTGFLHLPVLALWTNLQPGGETKAWHWKSTKVSQ